MNKRDWIWVAIRIFGIYLLVEAILALASAAGAVVVLYQHFIIGYPSNADAERALSGINQNMLAQLITSLCRLLVDGAAGLYFIKGAKFIFKLVCPPDTGTGNKSI